MVIDENHLETVEEELAHESTDSEWNKRTTNYEVLIEVHIYAAEPSCGRWISPNDYLHQESLEDKYEQ
jgi:hypothetical protein